MRDSYFELKDHNMNPEMDDFAGAEIKGFGDSESRSNYLNNRFYSDWTLKFKYFKK